MENTSFQCFATDKDLHKNTLNTISVHPWSQFRSWLSLNSFVDQPPRKPEQKTWLVRAMFNLLHCNSHAQMVLPGGCSFNCSKCYCADAKHSSWTTWCTLASILGYLWRRSPCDVNCWLWPYSIPSFLGFGEPSASWAYTTLIARRSKIVVMRIQPGWERCALLLW